MTNTTTEERHQWEYEMIPVDSMGMWPFTMLKHMGEQGWELVAIRQLSVTDQYFFKRPKLLRHDRR